MLTLLSGQTFLFYGAVIYTVEYHEYLFENPVN